MVEDVESDPDISLVIPAWNEAAYLPRLLDSVDRARAAYVPRRVEVIVADNGSTDATAAIARERGCIVAPVALRRIAAARNGGAAVARGRVLAFADADFELDPATFTYIDALMGRPEIVGGGTGLTMERWSAGIFLTWCLILPPLQLWGMDGGVWFCRRADFDAVGGYDERRPFGEDVAFLWALRRLGARRRPKARLATRWTGRRLGLAPPIAINSARKFDRYGEWHMFRHALTWSWTFLRSRRRFLERVSAYWYEGR